MLQFVPDGPTSSPLRLVKFILQFINVHSFIRAVKVDLVAVLYSKGNVFCTGAAPYDERQSNHVLLQSDPWEL